MGKKKKEGEPDEVLTDEAALDKLLSSQHSMRSAKGWLYTLAVFAIIALPLWFLLPWPFVIAVSAILTGITIYIITPWSLRKEARDFSQVPEEVQRAVTELSERAGVKQPRLKLMLTSELNAMAFRSFNGGVIVFTVGIIRAYENGEIGEEEFRAIIAHELAHIRFDHVIKYVFAQSWISIGYAFGTRLIQTGLGLTIAGEYVSQNDRELYAVYVGGGQYEIRERSSGVGGMMKILGILAIVFGWCMVIWAKLVSIFSLLLSRNQELEADDFAAELTSPAAMASALRQLEAAQLALDNQEMLALPYPDRWQVTPMKRSFIDRLWDTHPSTENRVSKMDALANALDFDTTLPALAEGSRDVESVSEEA